MDFNVREADDCDSTPIFLGRKFVKSAKMKICLKDDSFTLDYNGDKKSMNFMTLWKHSIDKHYPLYMVKDMIDLFQN